MIIRVLLIISVLAVMVVVLRSKPSHRSTAVRRIGLFVVAGVWVAAVIDPDLVTSLAHGVGVGRGTDLLLYCFVVLVLFATLGLHTRIARLEGRLVVLTRELAIARAQQQTETTRLVQPASLL